MWVVRVASSIALFASVCVSDFAVESDSRLRVGDAVYLANTEDVEVGGVGDVGDAVYLADTVPGDNKPIHCQMKPWGPWSPCGTDGYKQRHRDIDIAPDDHGRACPFDTQRIKCRKQDCRVCDWKEDECDKEHGTKRFWREIVRQPELDGEPCPTQLERVEYCDVDCEVYPDEFDISPECDENGDKWQYPRIKYHAKHNGAACPPPTKIAGACGERENCEYEPIPEDTPYGTCALDEESGVWYKSRDRVVAHEARNGGDECVPDRIECTRTCYGRLENIALGPSNGVIIGKEDAATESDCCNLCKRAPECRGYAFYRNYKQCKFMANPDVVSSWDGADSAYVRSE